jgi:carbamate kinase
MKIVIALGGNALGETPEQQLSLVKETAKPIVDLIAEGYDLVIAHGNGPQVGMIAQAMSVAHESVNTPEIPFPECGAMSQGYIGYHLQNAIREELKNRSIKKEVVSLITQVLVDKNDASFSHPTKPIGRFYSKEEAEETNRNQQYQMIEDSGRGYRRVIASPKPVDVVEKEVVKTLIEQGIVVITVGGGGIPVIEEGNQLIGVAAVIDKDFSSAKIADIIDADYLFILTAIDRVMINFNTTEQKALEMMNSKEAIQYITEGHFAPGSMLPKVQAALNFVEGNSKRTAVIASLNKAKEAIDGKTGTKIVWL